MDNVTATDNVTVVDDEITNLLTSINQAQYIVTPVLMVLGITGNCLVIATVTDPKFCQHSTRYTLAALAVSDSILLLTNVFNQNFITDVFELDVRALSTFSCKVFFVAYRMGKMSASWFIVLVAIERFVAVLFPFHVKIITTRRNTVLAIICVYVYNITVPAVWSFSTNVVGEVCIPDAVTPDNANIHKVFVIIGGLSYSLVPIMTLLVITPPIVYKLLVQRRRRQQLTQNATSSNSNHIVSRVSAMLIGIVLWYIVCVIPITLVLVLTFWNNKSIFQSRDKSSIIFLSVAQAFEQINHSSNFFIYIIFSNQFREIFLQKIRCRCSKEAVSQPSSAVWSSYLERFNST